MKKLAIILLACPLLVLTGCSSTPKEIEDTTGADHQPPLTNTLPGPANEYTLLFSGTNQEIVSVYHKSGESTKLFFINSEATHMKVKVDFASGVQGNLRRSQVVMPDGAMDGPFGTDVSYDLTQLGGYQLIFNENQMAGDPWSGNAQITITLQK